MSEQINLVINGKNSVENSFFATNFIQYLKNRSPITEPSTGTANSTLRRSHREADFINLEHRCEIDARSFFRLPTPPELR